MADRGRANTVATAKAKTGFSIRSVRCQTHAAKTRWLIGDSGARTMPRGVADRQRVTELLKVRCNPPQRKNVMAQMHDQHLPLKKSAAHRMNPPPAASRCSTRRTAPQRAARVGGMVLAMAVIQLAPAHAHDVWLAKVEQSASIEADVRIGLFIGDHAGAEAMLFSPSGIERMWLTTSHGVHELAATGSQVTLPAANYGNGSRTVAYVSKPSASVLPAAKFDAYLREEHLQSILLERQSMAKPAASGDDSSMVSERFSRSLKLVLTDAEQALTDCPVGLPLELSIVAADDANVVVQATFRGQPLAGAWVDRGGADGSILAEGVTDDNGRIALLRSDGDWVVRATHMLAADEAGTDWRSWWATTTFHLSAAGVSACAIP